MFVINYLLPFCPTINDTEVADLPELFPSPGRYSASSIEVVAGEQNLDINSGLEQSIRGSFKVLYDYSATTGVNDIGILRVGISQSVSLSLSLFYHKSV